MRLKGLFGNYSNLVAIAKCGENVYTMHMINICNTTRLVLELYFFRFDGYSTYMGMEWKRGLARRFKTGNYMTQYLPAEGIMCLQYSIFVRIKNMAGR